MKNPILRTLIAGLAGGLTMNVAMVLTFRLAGFGWSGGGILLNPSVQSQKLIAVWTQIEPLPLVVSNPAPIVFGLMLFGIGHALIYRWLSPTWFSGVTARTVTVKKKAKKDEQTSRRPKRHDRRENVMSFIYRPLSSTAQGTSNVR